MFRFFVFAAMAIVFAAIVTPRKHDAPADVPVVGQATVHKLSSFFDPPKAITVRGSSGFRADPTPPPDVSGGGETTLRREVGGHFYTYASVNGRQVAMLVDTGASTIALSVADARAIGLSIDPARFRVIGSGASGPVRGIAVSLNDVAVGGHHVANVDAAVLEGLEGSLLGQSYLRHLDSVSISGDVMTLR